MRSATKLHTSTEAVIPVLSGMFFAMTTQTLIWLGFTAYARNRRLNLETRHAREGGHPADQQRFEVFPEWLWRSVDSLAIFVLNGAFAGMTKYKKLQ